MPAAAALLRGVAQASAEPRGCAAGRGRTRRHGLGKRARCDSRTVAASAPKGTAAATAVTVKKGAADSSSPSTDALRGEMDWLEQWYAVADVGSLDPTRPTPITVLGRDMVAWRGGTRPSDGEPTWSVFMDRCPHRCAPLSEGRIEEDGHLMCSYHGWRFEPGTGACTSIPQLEQDDFERAAADPRSCVKVYPSQVRHGVLFVWPTHGADAALRAAATPLPLLPELVELEEAARAAAMGGRGDAPTGADDILSVESCPVRRAHWSTREVMYGYEVMMENLTDPAHLTVSHHGIMGDRKDAAPFELRPKGRVSDAGFAFTGSGASKIARHGSSSKFHAPNFIEITTYQEGGRSILPLYVTPSRPGRCVLVGSTVQVQEAGKEKVAWGPYSTPMPRWCIHVLGHLFMAQDMVFLHHQQRTLQNIEIDEGKDWRQACYFPGEFDMIAASFRRWLAANGPIPWPRSAIADAPHPEWTSGSIGSDGMRVVGARKAGSATSAGPAPISSTVVIPPSEGPEKLFDTWEMHTRHCKPCQDVYKRLGVLKFVLAAAAAASFVWGAVNAAVATAVGASAAAASSLSPSHPLATAWLGALALVGGARSAWCYAGAAVLFALAAGAHRVQGMFTHVYFSHADND